MSRHARSRCSSIEIVTTDSSNANAQHTPVAAYIATQLLISSVVICIVTTIYEMCFSFKLRRLQPSAQPGNVLARKRGSGITC